MSKPRPVVLIGASVRAAAYSALRAGLSPWCIDLFADADLRAIAPVQRCSASDYPRRLPDLLRDAPPGPVIYAGGLENHPRIIERIAAMRPVWGNDVLALRKCRDPYFVSKLYRDAGIVHPNVASNPNPTASAQVRSHNPRWGSGSEITWLRKPLGGAGGGHIRRAEPGDPAAAGFYFQQFISGAAFAAIFCSFADRVELLGITEQLVGESWLHAKPYCYCGSVGPIDLGSECTDALVRIGDVLRTGCALRGLFGVDFVLHEGEPWPIEVNPRYTASIEVLEHATGMRALEWHRAAFDSGSPGSPSLSRGIVATICRGKAILFAPRRLVLPDSVPWPITSDPLLLPDVADLPSAGDIIEEGWPILTRFATAASAEECRAKLMQWERPIEGTLFTGMPQPCRTPGRP